MSQSMLNNEQQPQKPFIPHFVEPKDGGDGTANSHQSATDPFMEGVVLDTFLDDDHDKMFHWALENETTHKLPPTTVRVLDVYAVPAKQELASAWSDHHVADLMVPLPDICKLRVIFLQPACDHHATLKAFSQYHVIPPGFWNCRRAGSFGYRVVNISPVGSSCDMWIQFLRKIYHHDGSAIFEHASFFLRCIGFQIGYPRNVRQILLICLDARSKESESLQQHILQLLRPLSGNLNCPVSLIMADPFHLLLVILFKWSDWNLELFAALEYRIYSVEQSSGMFLHREEKSDPSNCPLEERISEENSSCQPMENGKTREAANADPVDFPYLHLISKHLIQAVEIQETCIRAVDNIQKAHRTLMAEAENLQQTECLASLHADAALQYHRLNFEGVLNKTKTLEKRLGNQINLAFNLVQQRDAKIAQLDSSSMTTISLLTLFFLPATAIATIFGMPFFAPNDMDLGLVHSFRYFWAFTVPITFLLIIFWHWHQKVVSRIPIAEGKGDPGAPRPTTPISARTTKTGRALRDGIMGIIDSDAEC